MAYNVPACVTRRVRHTSSSTHQHGPSDQVGVPADVTFGRLSISGSTRRVRFFAGLGVLADPEARRLRTYGEHADVYPPSAEVLPSVARGRGDFPFLGG